MTGRIIQRTEWLYIAVEKRALMSLRISFIIRSIIEELEVTGVHVVSKQRRCTPAFVWRQAHPHGGSMAIV